MGGGGACSAYGPVSPTKQENCPWVPLVVNAGDLACYTHISANEELTDLFLRKERKITCSLTAE